MKTTLAALRYVWMPKSVWLLIARAMYYLPASCLVLRSSQGAAAAVLVTYLVLEGVIGSSRHVLNDLHDLADDRRRGGHWARFVTAENAPLVRALLFAKLLAAGVVIALVARPLGPISLAFLATQLVYDRVTKPRWPLLSAATVAVGYSLRAVSPFVWTALRPHACEMLALAATVFLYAFDQTLEWRHVESRSLLARRSTLKPGAAFFAALDPRRSLRAVRTLTSLALVAACGGVLLGRAWWAMPAMASVPCILLAVVSDRQVASLSRIGRISAVLVLMAIVLPHLWLRVAAIAICLPLAIEYEARVTMPRLAQVLFNPESRGPDGITPS